MHITISLYQTHADINTTGHHKLTIEGLRKGFIWLPHSQSVLERVSTEWCGRKPRAPEPWMKTFIVEMHQAKGQHALIYIFVPQRLQNGKWSNLHVATLLLWPAYIWPSSLRLRVLGLEYNFSKIIIKHTICIWLQLIGTIKFYRQRHTLSSRAS